MGRRGDASWTIHRPGGDGVCWHDGDDGDVVISKQIKSSYVFVSDDLLIFKILIWLILYDSFEVFTLLYI